MYAKTADFNQDQQMISHFARIFSHPVRVAIVQLLAEKKSCISGDISKEFPQLSRVTISQHLQELKNFGLIKGEIEGVKVCYCLNKEKFSLFKELYTHFFTGVLNQDELDCSK